jgi:hypothetical protein
MRDKDGVRAEMEVEADRINTSEALILLMDDDAVTAARAVDRCQAELKDRARKKMWDHDEWISVRKERLSSLVDEYCAAGVGQAAERVQIPGSLNGVPGP